MHIEKLTVYKTDLFQLFIFINVDVIREIAEKKFSAFVPQNHFFLKITPTFLSVFKQNLVAMCGRTKAIFSKNIRIFFFKTAVPKLKAWFNLCPVQVRSPL